MAHSEQREVGLAQAVGEELSSGVDRRETLAQRVGKLPLLGSMTIRFHDADGQMIPVITFAPLGRINPNTIERYLPHIYQEIQKQQVKERHNVG